MFNTPPTFGIYLMMLVFRWIRDNGGLAGMATRNRDKAGGCMMQLIGVRSSMRLLLRLLVLR